MYNFFSIVEYWIYSVSMLIFITWFISFFLIKDTTSFIAKYNIFSSLYFSVLYPIIIYLFLWLLGSLNFHDWYMLENWIGINLGIYFMFFYPVLYIIYLTGNIILYSKFKFLNIKYMMFFLWILGLFLLCILTYPLWTSQWID